MRKVFFATLLAMSTSAFAAEPSAAVTPGQMLRDAHNIRLGQIDQVYPDGTVGLIVESSYVHVPVATISMKDGKAITTMTKAELQNQ